MGGNHLILKAGMMVIPSNHEKQAAFKAFPFDGRGHHRRLDAVVQQ